MHDLIRIRLIAISSFFWFAACWTANAQERQFAAPLSPKVLPKDSDLRIPVCVPSVKATPQVMGFLFAPADAEVDRFLDIDKVRQRFQVSGAGLTVAVIDTGINPHHADFAGKIVANEDFTGEVGGVIDDTDGHGSNVASIVAGKGPDQGGINRGVAPGAKLAVLKVFVPKKAAPYQSFIRAFQWVLDHQEQHGISVVNLSVGGGQNLLVPLDPVSDDEKIFVELFSKLRARGVAVVVAAGNYYRNVEGMDFPGILKDSVSVGAVFDSDLQQRLGPYVNDGVANFALAGRCTPFTQRLSEKSSAQFRTDVFAPGALVTGAGPVQQLPDGTVDPLESRNVQTVQDGTSQAAPVVSGMVLLLQERYRQLAKNSTLPTLPSIDLIEKCLRDGREFNDIEDEQAKLMDNVVSSGQTFVVLDPMLALLRMEREVAGLIALKTQNARSEDISAAVQFLRAKGTLEQREVLKRAGKMIQDR